MNLPGMLYLLCRRGIGFERRSLKLCKQISRFGIEQAHLYLEVLLEYAADHVPYYARMLSGNGDHLTQLDRLPILTKALIRAHGADLRTDELAGRHWRQNTSGGSTGQPIVVVQDREFSDWLKATRTFYYRSFHGLEFDATPKVILWGSERDIFKQKARLQSRLWDRLTQTTTLNSFRMTPQDMLRYVQTINRKRPVSLRGYAGSLFQLARFIRARRLPVHRPRLIFTAAEALQPFMRQEIESVFGCQAFDTYGSREIGTMAAECRRGRLHIFSFNNLLEVVDEQNRPVRPGQAGRVLVTTLHNYAMPLIRYEIGDTAIPGDGCDCGSRLPTLERITGRVIDHFLTRDGTLIYGGYFNHLFFFREWVQEFQVLQTDFDDIQIYCVSKATPVEADMADINRKIRLVMGEACRIELHEVQEVPRTPHGKLLFTRSLVTADRIPQETLLP